jgi:hypothetical protein
VPGYSRSNSYDLTAIGLARREANAEPEYHDWELVLGSIDEAYYWYPDAGPSTVVVNDADEGTDGPTEIIVNMTLGGADGDLTVAATIVVHL